MASTIKFGLGTLKRSMVPCIVACIASLCVVEGIASAAPGVSIQDATPDQKKEAQSHYDKGAKLFELKKFDEALKLFQASYDVVKSPNAHLMIARAYIELDQPTKAYRELVLAEEEAKVSDKYVATLEKIRGYATDVKKRVALIRVHVTGGGPAILLRVGADAIADGEERAVMPGRVHVAALDGVAERAGQDVDLQAGDQKAIELTIVAAPLPRPIEPLPPVQPPIKREEPSSGVGYFVAGGVIAGVGIAGVITGTVLYFQAKSAHDDLEQVCGPDGKTCPAGSNDRIQEGKDKQAGAVIGWIAGGAAAALGGGLIIAGATKSSATTKDAVRTGQGDEPNVSLVVGPTWIGVSSRF